MLVEEAQWIGIAVSDLIRKGNVKRLLNIASSSLYNRNVTESHISEYIFNPLSQMDVEVVHTDIVNEEGIDIVGDISDIEFLKKLSKDPYDIVLCTNFLEHIENAQPIYENIQQLLKTDGFLLVSVPYIYPYHPDPVDTMFRPDIKILSAKFPQMRFVRGENLKGARIKIKKNGSILRETNCYQLLSHDNNLLIRTIIRVFLPFYKFRIWKYNLYYFKNLFTPFSVSCVILRRGM